MVAHVYRFWKLYSALVLVWLAQNFVPSALQGAESEAGQAIYGWLTQIDSILDGLNFLRNLGDKWG